MRRLATVLASVVAVCAVIALAPSLAMAEPVCTDTWTGASEGSWATAANWSAGHAPTSSDVACIGGGHTVTVSSGEYQVGVVEGEGGLSISGTLEITNALETSSIHSLVVSTGTLSGAGTLKVSGSFSWPSGTLSGTGSTILMPGASGSKEAGGFVILAQRKLVNEGTFTLTNGSIAMKEGAEIANSGTFDDNGSGTTIYAEGSGAAPLLSNTGVFQKVSGTEVAQVASVNFDNYGTLKGGSATMDFTGSGATGTLESGSVLEGAVSLDGPTVTGYNFGSTSGTVTDHNSSLSIPSGYTAAVSNFVLEGGGATVSGAGTLQISSSFAWKSGTMSGTGRTVLTSGATASKAETGEVYLKQRTLVNEGTFTLTLGIIFLGEGAMIENVGTFNANADSSCLLEEEPGGASLILNFGTFQKTAGIETYVNVRFDNEGVVGQVSGLLDIRRPVAEERSTEWGGAENPSSQRETAMCGDSEAVNCATGNYSQTQTDFTIGGRGVGLDLSRTYNSQAAETGVHGAFGYGWSSSFSDHIVPEVASKRATLVQANGSTVVFAEGVGGAFTAPRWTQDVLTGTVATGYSLTLANQTVYKFAATTGRLESVTDRNGNATTLGYEGTNLKTISDPAGRKLTLAYNGEGLVESVTDPMSHVVKYTYEGGNLASVTQPGELALRWQFKYDGSHQLTEMVDGRAGKALIEYNGSHQAISQTDPLKRLTTLEYTAFRTVTTNHATGAVTVQYVTSGGLGSSLTRAFGTASATTEASTYDSAQERLSVTDGKGHTTKYGYDTHGNQTLKEDPESHKTKWTYNSTHDIETETLPSGETTTYKRDAKGNPTTVERPAPRSETQITTYKYTAAGLAESMTDPLKRVWKYEYNANGDKTAEIDPESDKRTWKYNEDSQETSMVSPRGHVKAGEEATYTTSTERDAQGRPKKITDPLKHETKYTYDGDGNVEVQTDPEAHETKYTYDADNERTKTQEPNATITETGYDGAGQVTSQTDGNKHTTKYERNLLEQVKEIVDPRERKTTQEYDKAGNLTSITDAAKRTTTRKYNADNRLSEVTYSDGKTPTVKCEYTSDGQRSKMSDGTGTTSYEYDQLDRLTETKDGHGNVAKYEYDLGNEQTKITYPNGKAVTRAYDNAGRFKSVTDWLEHTSKFGYNADSLQTSTTFPAGTTNEDTYAYDATDAMSEVKMLKAAETLASLVYARNKDGQVTKATTKGLPGEEIPAFTYDSNSRLSKGAGIAYKYDAGNSPTTIGTTTNTYDTASELEKSEVSKVTTAKYSYDELGDRTKYTPTSGPAVAYSYDQAGRLTGASRPKEGSIPAIEDTYSYNGDGLRASQTISGSTTYMAWNTADKLPVLLYDGGRSYIFGPEGHPVEQINSEEHPTYVHHDQQGSTRLLTSSTGAAEATMTYDAYGNRVGSTGSAATSLGYDAQYTDGDTGLVYLRARYYDPATAQLLTVDPAVEQTRAPYGYAEGDPVNQSDPAGLHPQECWARAGHKMRCEHRPHHKGPIVPEKPKHKPQKNCPDTDREYHVAGIVVCALSAYEIFGPEAPMPP
jgi:RHS repeat-associated protein